MASNAASIFGGISSPVLRRGTTVLYPSITDWRSLWDLLGNAVCQHALSKTQAVPAGTSKRMWLGILSNSTPSLTCWETLKVSSPNICCGEANSLWVPGTTAVCKPRGNLKQVRKQRNIRPKRRSRSTHTAAIAWNIDEVDKDLQIVSAGGAFESVWFRTIAVLQR
jgi:hypothetical protein